MRRTLDEPRELANLIVDCQTNMLRAQFGDYQDPNAESTNTKFSLERAKTLSKLQDEMEKRLAELATQLFDGVRIQEEG